ncbi:med21 domain-containing protein [Haloprofundus halobius]|uniref:med21 domain-containing protein n=1 Tax=Haloprofundus halobius TaxID=2876194 RepID=UPI001CC996EC|nr:med21 domain-containing protein [Haloprofundus halobius]
MSADSAHSTQWTAARPGSADESSAESQRHPEALEARIRQLEAELEHVEAERQAIIDHYEGLLAEERSRTDSTSVHRQNEHPLRRLLGL